MAILTLTNDDSGYTIPIGGGGSWTIFGTDGVDILEVAAGTSVRFSGQSGVDLVRLISEPADYSVRLSGSSALFTHLTTGKNISMPVTSGGDTVQFTSGPPLTLKSSAVGVLLGSQVISSTDAPVTGLASATPPPGALTLLMQAVAFSVQNSGMGTLLSTSDASVKALTSGIKWGNTTLSYSFNTVVPTDYIGVPSDNTTSGNLTSNWSVLDQSEKNVVRAAFMSLSNFTSLHFSEVSSNTGDIRFSVLDITDPVSGFAYYPGDSLGGDVFLASSNRADPGYTEGSQSYMTVIHELGHAMGLKHPFELPNTLNPVIDNYTNTIMSYTPGRNMLLDFKYSGGSLSVEGRYDASPTSYSLIDVASLQAIYGANTNFNSGDNVYTVSYDQQTYLTIWDAGGNDTLNAANATGFSVVDLRPGQYSSLDMRTIAQLQAVTQTYYRSIGVNGADAFVASVYADSDFSTHVYTGESNVAIAHGVWLENVITGSGDDVIRDNMLNNSISTGGGSDLIQLFDGGFDSVDGGAGIDIVQVKNTFSQLKTEKQADGSYLIVGSYFAATLVGVESLQYLDGSLVFV